MSHVPGGQRPFFLTTEETSREPERISAELANLENAADPFAAAVRATRMPMLVTNPREAGNPIVFANDAFCRLTGYSRNEILGRNCRFLQGPKTDPAAVARIRAAIRATKPIEIDIRNYRKNGTPFWNRLLLVPVFDTKGALTYFFANQIDVTVERERLADLESHNAELAGLAERLAERSRELIEANDKLQSEAEERRRVEDALRQSQKMEAVGQLTGGIAHDFNNMLQATNIGLELARRRIEQGQAADALPLIGEAVKGVDRAAALTHRLLAFARRQSLDAKPVLTGGLILGMAELIQRTVGPAIAVRTRLGKGGWPVLCDANQLENALLNLAINARDAMPDGGVLTFSTEETPVTSADAAGQDGVQAGDYMQISVSDTGVGMTPDVLARAFEPYFTTKPTGQGTGLGLSQIYGFMRQSGGLVRLDSKPGQGTTVRLLLPRHHGDATAPRAQGVGQGSHSDGAGKVLMLVEDEDSIRGLAAEALREQGYAVLVARDGPAALQMLAGGAHVDLLVTDVGLPGIDGRQTAEMVRERRPGLPVLFITGYADGALRGPLALGMEVIGKPFTLDMLAAKVRSLLAGAEPTGHARAPHPAETADALEPPVVFVVDDDHHVREMIRRVLEDAGRVVEGYADAEAFLSAYTGGREACLLVDAYLPGMNGLELLQRLRDAGHHLPAIMITGTSDVAMAVKAMQAGALDFIEKPVTSDKLLGGISRALKQSRASALLRAGWDAAAGHIASLTVRQRQIMDLVLAGHPNKNIAADLGISQRTVENHRALIMKKTGAASVPALARLAIVVAERGATRL